MGARWFARFGGHAMSAPFRFRSDARVRRATVRFPWRLGATALSVWALSACGESGSTDPSAARGAQVAFSVTTGATGAPMDGQPMGTTDGTARSESVSAGLRVTSGSDELLISRVQLVVREVELERVGDDDDCDDLPRRGDDCDDDVEIGPFLIELPLADGVTPAIALQVPAGTYEELELVLHTPDDDDAEDRAFLAAHPGFRRVSAIVEGRFNGQPFTYVTRTRAKYELEFAPPITFGPEGDRVTVDVNVGAWFARRGGGLISPIDASVPGEARARVEQNIRHTFRAFRDRNRDGRRDDR
jgi:hypothetical protein